MVTMTGFLLLAHKFPNMGNVGEVVVSGFLGGKPLVAYVIRSSGHPFGITTPYHRERGNTPHIEQITGTPDKVAANVHGMGSQTVPNDYRCLLGIGKGQNRFMFAYNGGFANVVEDRIRRKDVMKDALYAALRVPAHRVEGPLIISAWGGGEGYHFFGARGSGSAEPDIFPSVIRNDTAKSLRPDGRVGEMSISGVDEGQLAECLYEETLKPSPEDGIGAAAVCLLEPDDTLNVHTFNADSRAVACSPVSHSGPIPGSPALLR